MTKGQPVLDVFSCENRYFYLALISDDTVRQGLAPLWQPNSFALGPGVSYWFFFLAYLSKTAWG